VTTQYVGPRTLPRLAVFNDSAPTLSTIAVRDPGYGVVTAQLSMMRIAIVDVEAFVTAHRPDVVVYDVAMPYESNWDFLEVVRMLPKMQNIPIVVTTSNKAVLDSLVGPTDALQVIGKPHDLGELQRRVDTATDKNHRRS
jgi:DNA-binding response OmpR family regulator